MRNEPVHLAGQTHYGNRVNNSWIDDEMEESYFADVRLGKRLRSLLGQMSNGFGRSIPFACQDWANTKAAYRFFDNDRISQEEILRGHFAATALRANEAKGLVLVLHDTSEFSYTRTDDCPIGMLNRRSHNLDGTKMKREHTLRGIRMHPSMAVTPEGLPLGLAAIKLWTRQKFKGTNSLKGKINPTRIPIGEKESIRWLENVRQSNYPHLLSPSSDGKNSSRTFHTASMSSFSSLKTI